MRAAGQSASEFASTVDELIRAGLLKTDEEDAGFRHRRVRYALLNAMSPPRRRALHEAMAKACEHLDQRERIVWSDRIAGHLLGSGELEKAAAFQLVAADLAYRRGALDEAGNLFEAIAATRAPQDASVSAPLGVLTLRARLGLVRIAEWRCQFAAALEGAGAIVQSAEGADLRDVKAAAEVCRARALFALGDPDSALRAARRAERLTAGWDGSGAWLAPDIFLARRKLCRPHRADLIAAVEKAHREALEQGLVLDVIETQGVLAVLSLDRHETDTLARLEVARENAQGLANARYDAMLDYLGGLAAAVAGDSASAESLFQRARTAAETAGDLYRLYMSEGERALLVEAPQGGGDVLQERVALLEGTLGSQRAAANLAARTAAKDNGDDGRALVLGTLHTAMRLNDAEGFRTSLDLAVGSVGMEGQGRD
jgi:tetratricopeptide (TPR) repeat protein